MMRSHTPKPIQHALESLSGRISATFARFLNSTVWLPFRKVYFSFIYSRFGRFIGLDQLNPANLPATAFSLVIHLVILLLLLFANYAIRQKPNQAKFELTNVPETTVPELERLNLEQLGQVADPTAKPVNPGSFAPEISSAIVDSAQLDPLLDIAPADIAKPAAMMLPEATRLDKNVLIRGTGNEYVGGIEGAVDRLATEIHNKLKLGPTLVVWLLDASGSLNMERERLAEQVQNIYKHVAQLDTTGLSQNNALLAMVIGFGQNLIPTTEEPIADPEEIASAIRQVKMDSSGIENTFQAVVQISAKYGRFEKNNLKYQPMAVIVTDEVGDDDSSSLELAVTATRKQNIPVYVLGSPSLFGQAMGRMNYRDPKTGAFYPNLEVRQGPESPMVEQIQIPFWYPQQNIGQPLSAGFGPYALSRLAGQSGGIYFISRDIDGWRQFRGDHLREYRPDLGTRAQYERDLQRWPLRQALVQASAATQRTLQAAPGLIFPPVEDENFNRTMLQQQAIAGQWSYIVDAALAPILKVANLRDREPSRRWRAHYDLMRGRLLALRVRCVEYNSACAKLRKDLPKFQNPSSNAWRLEPSDQIISGEKAKAAATEAIDLLKKVLADHPQTPWADLAQRELSAPLGFQWVEYTLPPPPRPMPGNAAPPPRPNNNRPAPPPIKL